MLPKIVSLIPSYNPQNQYVSQVIDELRLISDVVLFTTEEHNLNVTDSFYYDKSIGRDLVYKPREWILNNIEKEWDYVLYNEDDIFIPQSSITNVIKLYKTLPSPFIPGFIRYEYDHRDNTKRYFDMNPAHSVHMGGKVTVKSTYDGDIWEPWNLHSGNWIFHKNDIKNMISNNLFETTFKQHGMQYGNCDQLESAASTIYFPYTKVFPKDIESVECQHLPQKYIYFSINPTKQDIIC